MVLVIDRLPRDHSSPRRSDGLVERHVPKLLELRDPGAASSKRRLGPARNDGAHNFYSKEADFEKGVRALREWEQNQKSQQ